MTRVVAQGTFDLLHPGHVHYLEDAATHGDELHAIVARRANVTHKPAPILCAEQRRDMVAALGAVDEAHLGHPEDVFVPIERLDPDVIVLGFDQHHDEANIADALAERGIDCRVERASARDPRYEDELLSSGDIVDRILKRRDPDRGDGRDCQNGDRPRGERG
ncbi:adenylyltransferase/cytidyltransferase family protein [Halorubrum saccharovorum]|nr:adenylyltransferase/cytidyltransferase family protein [Halorubrum saccharovorum]